MGTCLIACCKQQLKQLQPNVPTRKLLTLPFPFLACSQKCRPRSSTKKCSCVERELFLHLVWHLAIIPLTQLLLNCFISHLGDLVGYSYHCTHYDLLLASPPSPTWFDECNCFIWSSFKLIAWKMRRKFTFFWKYLTTKSCPNLLWSPLFEILTCCT